MLFDPPEALNVIVFPGQISVGVPALMGGMGLGNACAKVPEDKGLSHAPFKQLAKYCLGSGFTKLMRSLAPVPIGFRLLSYHCVA